MARTVIPRCTLTLCPNRPDFQKQHSLDLSLHYGWIREACSVGNYKMPLVPCRVIPHIVFQEILHKLQLVVPQFVLLEIE